MFAEIGKVRTIRVIGVDLGDGASVVVDVDLVLQDFLVATSKGGLKDFGFVHGLVGEFDGEGCTGGQSCWRTVFCAKPR